jgi:23S rRNA (uracil1939-C5)-methyltransferase
MEKEFVVEITGMTFGGDALGRLPNGRAVFIPFALPGETVKVCIVEEKTNFARAQLLEVLLPSPQRISPRCRHFGQCGGCSYQNLAYPDQLTLKQEIVKDQLRRLGGLPDFPVDPVVPASSPWNYRNSIQFNLSSSGKCSFQRAGSRDLVEISECHLPQTGINELWPQFDFAADSGIKRVALREGIDGDILLGLESSAPQPPEFAVDFPISVVYSSPDGQTVLAGDEFVLMEVNRRTFKVSMQSFFQANLAQAGAMVEHVLQLAGDLSGQTVVDAYCGVGLFSAFLAPYVQRLIGIELSESACDDFAVNLDEFTNVELYVGAVEQVLPSLELKPDLVIIDPPRAGLDRRVTDALIQQTPKRIIYVSCDPATLSRDVKRLVENGYTLQRVTPFDQFPQTYHIECICLLEKV